MHDEKTLFDELKKGLEKIPTTGLLNKKEILIVAIDSLRENLGIKNQSKSAFRTRMKSIAKKYKLA